MVDAFGDQAKRREFTLDLYKSDQITIDQIKKKFSERIKKIIYLVSVEKDKASAKKMKESIVSDIKKMGDFSYVGISAIQYPNDPVVHFSVDVVDKSHAYKLPKFLARPSETITDPEGLIQSWMQYEAAAQQMSLKKFLVMKPDECPANHCLSAGFSDPQLKPYQTLFDKKVPEKKQALVRVLQKDKDEMKRASAAFLLGHLKTSKEVVEVLTPFMFDESAEVRNNVIRVLAFTFMKPNTTDFPIEKAIQTLNFPTTTDRNKSLAFISGLVDNPANADYVKKHARYILLDHLKLEQPNLKDFAHLTLKKISGKDYGENDYQAWKQWADSVEKPQ